LLHCKVFAIDVVSHLSLHYALPKSLAVARLAISVMSTMLTGTYVFDDSLFSVLCFIISDPRKYFAV